MSKKLAIINGPNLNLLGKREPEVYGDMSFDAFLTELKELYTQIQLHYFQSNIEGEIIDELQRLDGEVHGVILNAGGYTHTSVAIRDAIAAISVPVVEVHISNPQSREDFRHQSLLTGVCKGVISGFGLESYVLAIDSYL